VIHQCVSTNAICCNRLCSDLSTAYNDVITCISNKDSCNACSDSKNIFEMEEIVDDSDSIRSSLSHDGCLETICINNNNNILTNKTTINYNDEININNNIIENVVLNNNLFTIPIISDMYANYQQQFVLQNVSYQSLFNTYYSTIPWQVTTPIGTDESIDNISTFSNQINKNFYKNLNIKKRMLISVPVTLSSMETEPAMKYMKYLQYQTTF